MTGDTGRADGEPDADADTDAGAAGLARRAWRSLVAAARWAVDTFRGYSGAHRLRDRQR